MSRLLSDCERRLLPPERRRKSEMVREEVVLVVQEEIVSALLLFCVLRDREDSSVSVSIKLYQQVFTATIKENSVDKNRTRLNHCCSYRPPAEISEGSYQCVCRFCVFIVSYLFLLFQKATEFYPEQ